MSDPEINFCRRCGSESQPQIPPGEDRIRAVCRACGYIDYVNPRLVVGTVPVFQDGRILLCRRAIEPRRGYWTLPAGFLEVGETAAEGATRETREEAGARIELEGLYTVLDVVHAGQVHVFYRARLLDLDLAPGPETLENAMVSVDELPWDELAFRTVARTLELYVADRAHGEFPVHTGAIGPSRPPA